MKHGILYYVSLINKFIIVGKKNFEKRTRNQEKGTGNKIQPHLPV